MSTTPAPRPGTRRRLLAAARCRFAEDRLAEAVSAGMRQVVLLGTALDTFACHNPYRELRVIEVDQRDFVWTSTPSATAAPNSNDAGPGFDSAAPGVDLHTAGYDPQVPAFVIRLSDDLAAIASNAREIRTSLAATLQRISGCAAGSEVVFDYLPERMPALAEFLRDTGFEVLEDLDAAALACRYLDRPVEAMHSSEPRVIRARVRNNVGRPPSSLFLV